MKKVTMQLLATVFLACFLTCTKGDDIGDICFDGYINSSGYCFKVFQGQNTIAHFARQTCEHNNGHLAFIDSQEKNNALVTFLKNYPTTDHVYIDGRRQYTFEDINYEGLEMGFTNWDHDFTEITEECVVMDVKTGTWFLNSCFDYNSFVCEMYM